MKHLIGVTAIFALSNTSLAMDAAHKTQFSQLVRDLKQEIQKIVLEDKTHNRNALVFPKEGDYYFITDLSEDEIKSNTWNKLGHRERYYLWQKMYSQIGLYCTVKLPSEITKQMLVLSTPSLNSASLQTDGPNNTHDVLIAGHSKKEWPYTIHYHLKQIPSSHNKTVQQFGSHTIPNQRLVTLALAPSHAFAILGKEHSEQQILSWYRYNEQRIASLNNRSKLLGRLSQIAFVTPNILMAHTSTKKLVTLWLNAQNQLKFQLHKIPFAIEQFAIDSQNRDFLAFTYHETKKEEVWALAEFANQIPPCKIIEKKYFSVAVSSLKNRDKNGKYPFKTKRLEQIPSKEHSLEFINGVVIIKHDDKTTFWKVPAALFSTFLIKKI